MKEMNYWNQFACTGKVEDYLHYRQVEQESAKLQSEKEDSPYAGFYNSNRDGSKDRTHRRI